MLDKGITKEKNVLRLMGTVGRSQGDYEMKWWHTFGPIHGEQKLKLQLKKIYEQKLASSKFDLVPTELNKKAATFKDESGSTFTLSSFAWEPGKDEDPGKAVLTVEGTLGKDVVQANFWSAKDEHGNPYQAGLDAEYKRDKDGRVHFKGTLEISRMEQQPKSLTESFAEYTVEHDVKWEVPIEIK